MPAHNFLFMGNGSTENRGCEAILLSTYDLLKAAFPGSHFVNSSYRDPRVFKEPYLHLPNLKHAPHPDLLSPPGIRWQIAKRLQGHTFNFQRFLPSADYVLALGGDNYSLDYGSARTYFNANEVVLRAGRKLILWGCSVGPFTEDPALEHYAAQHLKQIYRIVVRESRTQAYLASLGVSDNVVLLPDPAFSLEPIPVRLTDDLEALLDAGAIGLNLSPLLARYRAAPDQWPDEAAAWVRGLLAAVDEPVLLIPHVMQPGNDDQAFLAEVAARLGDQRERVKLLPAYPLSSRQLKHVISRLRIFIGARTHATIAALSSSVPTLSIGYSVKALGINEDIFGNDEWVIDHKTLTPDLLSKKVQLLLQSVSKQTIYLKNKIKDYRMIFNDLFQITK